MLCYFYRPKQKVKKRVQCLINRYCCQECAQGRFYCNLVLLQYHDERKIYPSNRPHFQECLYVVKGAFLPQKSLKRADFLKSCRRESKLLRFANQSL